MNWPLQPHPHECTTLKAKFSGSCGGQCSSRKDFTSLSASRLVIIPHLRDEMGMAPALLKPIILSKY